ncbi:hypothetical protein M426DRAFT_8786 [Hypoxylon sp. CI-4A]|nr:hypothetical protein M426DRAFT_8786 [Hypoxylon sp. CI-4A]
MALISILSLALLALATENDTPPGAVQNPDALPAISPPFDYNGAIETGLQEHLPSTPWVLAHLDGGKIPKDCKDRAQASGYNYTDMDIFQVYYEDCGEPWTMCRLKDAKVDAISMAETFGKMPLGMREYNRHVIQLKGKDLPGAAAVSAGDTIAISEDSWHIWVFAHEMSHSLDSHVPVPGVTPDGQGGLSISQEWASQFGQDRATVSEYARTKWSENLAETGIVALYNTVVPTGTFSLPNDPRLIFHQYATYQMHYGDIITPKSKSNCTQRLPSSQMVIWNDDDSESPVSGEHSGFKVGVMEGVMKMRPGLFHNETCSLPGGR